MTHADAAEYVLKQWGLERFIPLVAYHHKPLKVIQSKAGPHGDSAVCVALANAVANTAMVGFSGSTVLDPVHETAKYLELTHQDVRDMLSGVSDGIGNLKISFMGHTAEAFEKSYRETVLQALQNVGHGMFVAAADRRPDEVELFLDMSELLAESEGTPPVFVVCRSEKGEKFGDCLGRIQSKEKALGLAPLPAILLVDERFIVPSDYTDRRVFLVSAPTSVKVLLGTVGAAAGGNPARKA